MKKQIFTPSCFLLIFLLIPMIAAVSVAHAGGPNMVITDNVEDNVYFEGDQFSIDIAHPELGAASGLIPEITQQLLFDDPTDTASITETEVFKSYDISPIQGETFTITGTVDEVDTPGVMGAMIILDRPDPPQGPGDKEFSLPFYDSETFDGGDTSVYGAALTGVSIPPGDVTSSPELSEFVNLYDTEDTISFVREGQGTIAFGPGLNIIDNNQQLAALEEGMNIVGDAASEDFYVEIDPGVVGFLAEREAKVSMSNILFDTPTIHVTGFGDLAGLLSDTDPRANETAELIGDVLSFKVDNFSRYTVLEKTEYSGPNWYVSADTGSDQYDGSVLFPFQTISKALAQTKSFQESGEYHNINVMAGLYQEELFVDTGGVSILGSCSETTIVDFGDSTEVTGAVGLTVRSGNDLTAIAVRDIRFRNFWRGLDLKDNNTEVSGVVAENMGEIGVRVESLQFFAGDNLSKNNQYGYYLKTLIGGASNQIATNNDTGFYIEKNDGQPAEYSITRRLIIVMLDFIWQTVGGVMFWKIISAMVTSMVLSWITVLNLC